MAYKTNDARGMAGDGIRCLNANGADLLEIIRDSLQAKLEERGVPARISSNVMKSGGLLGSKAPMLVVTHPNPPSEFFDIGIVINDNLVSFPLLGQSAQNAKVQKLEGLREQGKLVRSWLVRPDEFILQQEGEWQRNVLEAVHACFDD